MDFLRIFQKPISQVADQHACGLSRMHSCDAARSRNLTKGERHEVRLQTEAAIWLLRRAGTVP